MRACYRAAALALFLALGAAAAPPPDGRIRILTTVLPLREFAAAVAGDRGEATLLLPPGAGVHTWQPRPADVAGLAACDLLLYIGSGLEPWLPDLLKAFPPGRVRTLEAASGLSLAGAREEGRTHGGVDAHGPLDPHVWLDFDLDVRMAERIAAELARIDPEGGPEFAANALRLADRLKALDAEFREGLAACRGRDVVVAGHGAFGYLTRRYGLVQTALYGLSPDAQPKPGDVIKAVDLCRTKGIRTVFFENSVPPDLSRTLAREIGGRAMALHSGHNLTRVQQRRGIGFFELMRENLSALREGLACR